MAVASLTVRYDHFPLSGGPTPLFLGRRFLILSRSLRSVSSGAGRPVRLCACHRGKGNVEEEISEERLIGDVADVRRGSSSEAGRREDEGSVSLDGFEWKWPPWKELPMRYKLIGATSLAFVVCNMDKVNLSVAIIPMSHQFGWNSSTAGLVQSSFFWGYALSQLPGGWIAKIFGGRKVLEVGVLSWSLATILVPIVSGFMPGLILSRILFCANKVARTMYQKEEVGIGEGVSPSAATDLIARSIPLQERSRAVAFVFGGLSVGSVLGLLFAPPIIQTFGWESVFYVFGILGIVWCLAFEFVREARSPYGGEVHEINGLLLDYVGPFLESTAEMKSWSSAFGELIYSLKDIPWKAFVKSQAIWAMVYAHFCGSWGHYTCLSWLPTYFGYPQSCPVIWLVVSLFFGIVREELGLNLAEAAWVSILPPLSSILVTSFAASFADKLISNGVDTTKVRKICQTIAFLSPAFCMTLSSLDLGLPPWEVVGVLTTGLALSSFALSGLYCTHQDISPEYASVLLGMTNTVGAVPGIVGVALTGFLLDSTHSWSLSLFAPSIFFYLSGTAVWLLFASSKPQNFSKDD